jgi:hypothetical protein
MMRMESFHFNRPPSFLQFQLAARLIIYTDWQRAVQTGGSKFTTVILILAILRGQIRYTIIHIPQTHNNRIETDD